MAFILYSLLLLVSNFVRTHSLPLVVICGTHLRFSILLIVPTYILTFSLDVAFEKACNIWLQVIGFTLS